MTDLVGAPGEVKIDEVSIVTMKGFYQDITMQVIGIEIYEDIFSPFVTGKIVLKDAQEISNLMPLSGEEIVRIKVRTPSLAAEHSYDGEYYIHKMDDRMNTGERELLYVLHFMSKEGIIDLNRKISKAYSGKISDIAKKILTDNDGLMTKKKVNIEETQNITKYVSNFWSPTKNMKYLCENAVNTSGSPTYVFFENKYGLHFGSLDTLYSESPLIQTFVWDNYSAKLNPGGGSSRELDEDYKRILELRTPETFDYAARLRDGMYGSELIAYDILTKQYVHVGYTPDFKETKHLNKYPLNTANIPTRTRSTIIREHLYYNNFDGFDDVTNVKTIQKRTALMAEAEAFKIEIDVYGRTDYSVGQRVYVEVPRRTQITDKDTKTKDEVHTGYYLISAMCHNITRKEHRCTMELIKDSFITDFS